MPKLIAITVLAFVAGTSATFASAPPSGPLPADALTVILPGARAEAVDFVAARQRPRNTEPAMTQEDVVITGGPAAKPPSGAPALPRGHR